MAYESEGSDAAGCGAPASRLGGWVETAAIVLLFAAAGAWPTPDTNEAVYLTKARHAAEPAWGRGDFFLETPDAHGVFYLLMGPLAAALPLDQAAWIGRVLGWLALAVGFRHAVAPMVRAGWPRLLAAALFSLALRNTTAAGEWAIGGCEAKVFAWALACGGVGEFVRGRFSASVFLLGAATAVHPIVGGWALVAVGAARLLDRGPAEAMRPALRWTLLVAGLLLAAAGVVPALSLSAGVDAATRAAATRIYVVERLSHHLLVRTFADGMVARHVLAVVAWWILSAVAPPSAGRRRLDTFTAAALGISLAGCGISLLETWMPSVAYGLLRYYWFRLADVAVPLALAVAATAVLADDASCRAVGILQPALARWAVLGLLMADLANESRHWPLPGRAVVARADGKVNGPAWADICDWVRDHAPVDACFVTPRGAASFTWRTNRREVVSWKNSPQDAASLVEWRKRIVDCFSRGGSISEMERSTVSLGAQRLGLVAERYGADHAIVPLDAPGLADVPLEPLHANGVYGVYRIAPP